MESLNLNVLANSLPPANLELAEKDLNSDFKAAARSITTLYRSSRHASKRAYGAGYAAACQDLLVMIQQGVSAGGIAPSHSIHPDGGEMTIGRVMDWIEARLDAVKSRQEEEEEDWEKEKEKEKPSGAAAPSTSYKPNNVRSSEGPTSSTANAPSASQRATGHTTAPLTPHSPSSTNNATLTAHPSSPSPPPHAPLRQIHHFQTGTRPIKTRALALRPKDAPDQLVTANSPITPSSSDSVFRPLSLHALKDTSVPANTISGLPDVSSVTDFTAGAKRRHAVMMMLDSTGTVMENSNTGTSTISQASHNPPASGSSRRRTRSTRNSTLGVTQSQMQGQDAMEVEEEGRERKRVARR